MESMVGSTRRLFRFAALGFVVAACLAVAGASDPASGVVICQKKKKVKMRPDVCKRKETQVLDMGDDPAGVWSYTGSEGRGGPIGGTPFLDTGLTPEYLTLSPDGSGSANLVNLASGVLSCGSFTWARGASPSIVLDLSEIQFQGTRVLLTEVVDDSVLRLTDTLGATLLFSRADVVDPAFECQPLAEVARFEGLPEPESRTGLAWDGVSLWFEEEGTSMIYPVDPGTGAVGTPVDLGFSQYSHVKAMQGASFWTTCGCGSDDDARLRDMTGTELDVVDTETDLGEQLNFGSLAYDASGGVLWMAGYSSAAGGYRLFQVDSVAEPDVLLASSSFDTRLASIAWDGTWLWGLAETSPPTVVRIDTTLSRAAATYSIPDESVQWYGIAVVGSQIFLVGRNSAGEGVVAIFTP